MRPTPPLPCLPLLAIPMAVATLCAADLDVPSALYPDLTSAVAAAADGDTIRVAAGVYYESLMVSGKSLTIVGAESRQTILDGEKARQLLLVTGGEIRLIGLTFQNGVAAITGGAVSSDGAIWATDCTFNDNWAVFAGGAVQASSAVVMVNCDLVSNQAAYGGAVFGLRSVTLINCLLRDNAADQGGAVGSFGTSVSAWGCTFAGNSAPRGGASIMGGTVWVANSILWETPGAGACLSGAQITVASSNVQGGWPGDGNLDADPLFVDAAAGDYRLQAGSPCRNAGDHGLLPPDLTDLDGDGDLEEPVPYDRDGLPRVAEGTVDLGAFEYQPATGPTPMERVQALRVAVQELVAGGARLPAAGRPLLVKLDGAIACLAQGDAAGAIESLTAFHHQVRALGKTGRLTGEAAAALMAEALSLITELGG